MNPKLTKLVLVTLFLLAQSAGAVVLWDQSDFDPWGMGFYNSESGSPPMGMTWHTVNHVTVDDVWLVDSISTYYSAIDPNWGGAITEGYLHVFEKTGVLPDDVENDPTLSALVPMTAVLNVDHFVLTASALNLNLNPGEYWIGLTPIAPAGMMGPEIHLSSGTLIGDASASYDVWAMPGPPAWFNFNPGLDAALLLDGTIVSATSETTWGAVKSLYR